VRYLETPLDAAELARILDLLGLEPRDLLRSKEAAYEARALADPALDRDRLIAAMVEEPILIERPIYVKDGRAVIGRPPVRVLELL
jgi:arsenate reductase